MPAPYLVHRLLLGPVLKLAFGGTADGRAHVRDLDQLILVANHNSHLDLPLLYQLLTRDQMRRTRAVAAHEYFARSPLVFGTVNRLFHPIWVVRRIASTGTGSDDSDPAHGPDASEAMAAMLDHLGAGGSIVIFPEGTRGKPGEIARFRRGIGRLAMAFPDVPIVPVFLAGPERALPRSQGVPVPLWTRVIVGPPFHPAERTGEDAAASDVDQATAAVESRVRGLAEWESARRHRRYERRRPGPAIAVLGIDGSGKSTLARSLAERLSDHRRVALLSDEVVFYENGRTAPVRPLPVERLRRALNRWVKTAGSLRSYKVPKLVELLLRDRVAHELRRWNAADLLVLDGCPVLNLAAWARLYHEAEYSDDACADALRVITTEDADGGSPVFQRFPELRALVRLRLTPLHLPQRVLFIDVEPATAMARIRDRGETRQSHETEERLRSLREGYLTVCRVLGPTLGVPAEIVDGHPPPDAVLATALRRVDSFPSHHA